MVGGAVKVDSEVGFTRQLWQRNPETGSEGSEVRGQGPTGHVEVPPGTFGLSYV